MLLLATATVVDSSGTPLGTLRMPLHPDITVRDFAVEAVTRFLRMRADGQQRVFATQVYVGSRVLLFFDDKVSSVVDLPNEPIFISIEHSMNIKKDDMGQSTPVQTPPTTSRGPKRAASPALSDVMCTPCSGGAGVQVAKEKVSSTSHVPPSDSSIVEPEPVRRLGWGKEAYKHFDENYVPDPDALIRRKRREKRMQQREQLAQTAIEQVISSTEPSLLEPPDSQSRTEPIFEDQPTARRLRFISEVAESASGVTSAFEDDASNSRPKGWGKEATRYFDAATYCSNPNKARLPPELLQGGVRTRRR